MGYVPYLALAAAFVLIYLPRMIVGREMKKLDGGYDNRDPRGQQQQLAGLGKRALAAHHNGFEAFAPFAAGVLAAGQRGVRIELAAALAATFVVARAIYLAAYLGDRATLRSGAWTLGILATAALLIAAIVGP